MGSFFLQQGLVISRMGQTLEFAARTEQELYFEEPETGKRITLTENAFWFEFQTQRIKIVDAFSSPKLLAFQPESTETQFRNIADLPQKFQDDVERKLTYITKLREAGITRGQKRLIAHEAKRIALEINDPLEPPAVSTLNKWWREFSRHNYEVYVLISGHADRHRGLALDDDSEEFLQRQIDEGYAIRTRPTASGAHRQYAHALREANKSRIAEGLPLLRQVAERTFRERIAQRPQKDLMVARLGREATRRAHKMIRGHLPADHPLDLLEIDHTPLNIYVIDDLSFLPLGRPWLTAIKDRYSKVILGFYVSFKATGLDSIFGAIKHSLTSHFLAYELWTDLENPWPAFGRGHYYLSDRGGDFKSPRYRSAIVSLTSLYEYCERRTPWIKPSIERFFLTLEQTFFEAMPGRTFANLGMRSDYDPAAQAVVRFSTLIYLLHKWAADFHNVFPNKRKQARPLDLWLDGIDTAPPPYIPNLDQLDIILGEHQSGKLSQEGLRFSWLTYADDSLREVMDLVGPGTRLDFVVSREDLGQINVRHPKTDRYFSVPCTRPEYASGLSLLQHQYLRKQAGIHLERASAVDELIDTRWRIQEVLREELEARANVSKVGLARIAGITSTSVLEGQRRSIITPFEGQTIDVTPTRVDQAAAFTNVPQYSWGN